MLELQNISYIVDDEGTDKDILKNVSLKLDDDKFFVITGPNGGGKSSLAKIIAGIYKPTSGKIIYNGTDITNMSITDRAKMGIGFAFQQPVRFKGLTVKDLLELAAGKEMKASACDYLSEVGLCAHDYINREINASLSGGELKRIEIAVTIARGTKLTIFDEPEAGIDLWSFSNLIKVFEDLKKKTMGSIMIISHQERIINIADELILIANGEVVKQGSKEEIMPLFTGTSFKCKFK
ncbi:MAG: ATP-binding cassette domain-containing protein [Lachnospiraceae bacterium]|nr:ATP-binding cassette domain-containing protein [Lachnospiraceae bacterium]